jgi:serine/threonine protein kinase
MRSKSAMFAGTNSWSGSVRLLTGTVIHEDSASFESEIRARESSAAELTRLPSETVLAGTYRLDRLLGSGAMASVFAATHLGNANRVAVKVLHPALESNVDVRARFLREGYAANSVGHAGTVHVLDNGRTAAGTAFFVMELLEGETLDALWERRGRRLPPSEIALLMCQLLDVLSAAHANGIVHRDIKPENLFIELDGTLRVLDFGVARMRDETMAETRAGSVIGTLPYMPPEQTLGKSHDVDARSDLWSVGATAFRLVSGRFVHEAETSEEMMVFIGSRQARSLAEVAPGVPAEFIRVVDRALRFDKAERWPSALSMQSAFAKACRSRPDSDNDFVLRERPEADPPPQSLAAGVATVSERPVLSPMTLSSREPTLFRPQARGHRWLRSAAAALALACLIGVLLTYGRRSPPRAQATGLVSSLAPLAHPAGRIRLGSAESGSWTPVAAPQAPAEAALVSVASTRMRSGERGRDASLRVAPPEAPKAPASKTAAQTTDGAVVTSDARLPASTVAAASDPCSPPYMVLPVTRKKLWKRECL